MCVCVVPVHLIQSKKDRERETIESGAQINSCRPTFESPTHSSRATIKQNPLAHVVAFSYKCYTTAIHNKIKVHRPIYYTSHHISIRVMKQLRPFDTLVDR